MRFLFSSSKKKKKKKEALTATNGGGDGEASTDEDAAGAGRGPALTKSFSGRVAFTLGAFGPIVDVVLPPPPRVVVATLNVGGAEVTGEALDLWLRRGAAEDGSPAALVLVGVQEASRRTWEGVEEALARHLVDHERVALSFRFDKMAEGASARRIGLGLFCFVAKGWRCSPSGAARYVNLGLEGKEASNVFKGALAARVQLRSDLGEARPFEVVAVVAHLPAHEGQVLKRVRAVHVIQDALEDYVARADAAFFFGDLNFRVDPTGFDVRDGGAFALAAAGALSSAAPPPRTNERSPRPVLENADVEDGGDGDSKRRRARTAVLGLIDAEDYEGLLRWDELENVLAHVRATRGDFAAPDLRRLLTWRDARPTAFPPTFKVERGTAATTYNAKRIPAYTDRVLYAGRARLVAHAAAHDVAISDHKPTRATFALGDEEAPIRRTPTKRATRRGSLGSGARNNEERRGGRPGPGPGPSPGLSPGVSSARHAKWEQPP